jgi:hypothetical protein
MKKQMISFTIPQHKKLAKRSNELGIPISELVRRIIDYEDSQSFCFNGVEVGFGNAKAKEVRRTCPMEALVHWFLESLKDETKRRQASLLSDFRATLSRCEFRLANARMELGIEDPLETEIRKQQVKNAKKVLRENEKRRR